MCAARDPCLGNDGGLYNGDKMKTPEMTTGNQGQGNREAGVQESRSLLVWFHRHSE